MYGQPRSSAAQAYIALAGSTGPLRPSAAVSFSGEEWTSPVSNGGSVEVTLTTTT